MEMAPLLDIVFLLLTFFIYAFLLMVRVDFVPMQLKAFESGVAATPAPAATISIDLDGTLFLDRVRVETTDLVPAIQGRLAEEPRTVLYLAIADGEGSVDRTPRLLTVWDELQRAGINVNLVGTPPDR
ncbi:MAG: biopolymer transporter ExbD [Planctomycetota bacterium]|nr:biopolymer transporter ExbD [Planctomycetota bacterium]